MTLTTLTEPSANDAGSSYSLLERLERAVLVLGAQGSLAFCNASARRLLGCNPATPADLPALLREPLAAAHGALQRGDSGAITLPMLELAASEQVGGAAVRGLRIHAQAVQAPDGTACTLVELSDASIEHQLDLACAQLRALVDATGVALATFQKSSGWQRGVPGTDAGPAAPGPAALQAIGRDVVEPPSLAEYERLQAALRRGERAAARYAVRHPEIGTRWLATRVEPAYLASGQPMLAVTTLDVTEHEQLRAAVDALQRELDAVLDSSPAGIAYLQGDRFVRCSRRFAHLFGIDPGTLAGAPIARLMSAYPEAQALADELERALHEGALYETEILIPGDRTAALEPRWCSMTLRPIGESGAAAHERTAILLVGDITRVKMQQARLDELVRDRELAFSLSGVGIATLRDGRIERANAALAQLLGYAPEALIGFDEARLFEDRAEALRITGLQRMVLARAGHWLGEHRMLRRDGSVSWVQASLRLLHEGDVDGGVIASYVDVTERRHAQESLVQQAQRTRAVLDSVLVGIVTVERGGIEWMNRSARRMFGGELSDFFGQPIAVAATPEPDHPLRQDETAASLELGQAHTFECQIRGRDGRQFWVAGNVVATSSVAGERQLTYALLDIDRRRQAEAKSAQSQASLQRIIESAPLAISLHDAHDLRILQINEMAAEMLGRCVSDCLGRSPEELLEAEVAAAMREDMEQALAAGELTRREYLTGGLRGQLTWEARCLPLATNREHAPDQLLMVATDVTEQRIAERARLKDAIEQRDVLVREVHHRIKNNLQGVAGLLQQVSRRRPEVAPVIGEAVAQVQAIAQVYGLQVGSAGPLPVVGLVEAIVRSVERLFGRTVEFAVTGGADHRWMLPEAESIPIALTVNELLTNAMKHAGTGAVQCSISSAADEVRIAVGNRGRLPIGFDLNRVSGSVSGLGLVKALLPRRGAQLAMSDADGSVIVTLSLASPSVIAASAG